MIRSLILIYYLLLFCSQPAWNQKPVFTDLGVRNGLPATEVYNLFQDKDGYIWAFPEYGIVKHNGSVSTLVCTNITFKERAVYAVAAAPNRTMYFANSQVYIYKIVNDSAFLIPGSEKIAEEIINSNGNVIADLTACDDGTLWYSTFFKSYSLKDRTVSHKTSSETKPKGMKPFLRINGHYLELTDSKRILKKFYYASEWFGSFKLFEQGEDCYLSINTTIYRIRNNSIVNSIVMNTIAFEIAPDGSIWVGVSNNGLYKFDADLSVIDHFLENITISDILFDNQSGMWVSTIGQGIFYCSNTYSFCNDANSRLEKEITLLKKFDNKLYIGTGTGELFVKNRHGFSRTDLSKCCSIISDIICLNGITLSLQIGTPLKQTRHCDLFVFISLIIEVMRL